MNRRVSVIVAIPCFRCEQQIPRVLQNFHDNPDLFNEVDRVVIIDNRSPDRTVEAATQTIERLRLSEKVSVRVNDENYGLGGSHKVAFAIAKAAGFDYVAIIHGDDQAKASELLELIATAKKESKMAAVLGSRFSKGSRLNGYSKVRIAGNRALNTLYSLLMGRGIYDLGSGLNLFRCADLDMDKIRHFSDRFTFNMDLLLYFLWKGLPICFFPISWSETDQVSNARNFRVGFGALKALMRWRFIGPPSVEGLPRYQSQEFHGLS